MINSPINLEIFMVIILLGVYIWKKKVETKSGFFVIGTLIFSLLIFQLALFYFNLNNKLRTEECLISQTKHQTQQIIPVDIAKPNLLSKPFNQFFINTSHNTYLPCNQNGDVASTKAITNALEMGARVIELDVFTKNNIGNLQEDLNPVVVHGIKLDSGDVFTTSQLDLKECVQTISKFAQTTSDPIWIDIELNTNNVSTKKQIKQILTQEFAGKLLGSEFKVFNGKKHFSQEPIGSLLNKIILTTSKKLVLPEDNELANIFDSYAGDKYYSNNSADDKINKEINKIHRVYPAGNFLGHLSFNYDPEPFWNKHIQLVALNFQTNDCYMGKNLFMFKTCSFVHFSELPELDKLD